MKYYLVHDFKDLENIEEIRIVENFGKAICYDRYNRISEEWERKTVNAIHVIDESRLEKLKEGLQT